ncbi:AAA family ATPase [Segatella copri]
MPIVSNITGSNAKMLSGELATRLRGRYIAYRIRGLCYEEFLTFHELKLP